MDAISQFRIAMGERQIIPPVEIITDGKIHRCDAEGKNGRGDAAYLLHIDGVAAGGIENHRDGRGWENWRADVGRTLTAAEEQAIKARVSTQRAEREQKEAGRLAETKRRATAIWEASTSNVGDHAYLKKKGIAAGTEAPSIAASRPHRRSFIGAVQYVVATRTADVTGRAWGPTHWSDDREG